MIAELLTAPLVWVAEGIAAAAEEAERRAWQAQIELHRETGGWVPWLRPVWVRVDDLLEAGP